MTYLINYITYLKELYQPTDRLYEKIIIEINNNILIDETITMEDIREKVNNIFFSTKLNPEDISLFGKLKAFLQWIITLF